jgi:antitoxin ParD1/3/4
MAFGACCVYGEVMNVHLGPVFDEFVAGLLKSGYYQTQSEVLREGLRLLKEREETKRLRLAELRKEIAVGMEQADRGQFVDGPEAFAKIRQSSTRRKRSRG